MGLLRLAEEDVVVGDSRAVLVAGPRPNLEGARLHELPDGAIDGVGGAAQELGEAPAGRVGVPAAVGVSEEDGVEPDRTIAHVGEEEPLRKRRERQRVADHEASSIEHVACGSSGSRSG